MVRPLHIRGAHVWDGRETVKRDLYTNGKRITTAPVNGAQVIDIEGYTIFPGLINAHDHLELNHYPRSKFRERYDNARQWHEDMNVRLNDEPYKSLRAYPLWDKLFIGGLKNLLCGAITVAHHNPPHKDLWRKDFPVRVLKNYGWSHSFYLSTDEEIQRSYKNTPDDWPWFIHLAEGTDEVAAGEYQRLDELGCIDGPKTVLIHCVGMRKQGQEYPGVPYIETDFVAPYVLGAVWCPTTNLYLLGKTLVDEDNRKYTPAVNALGLGSDSRLTGEGDLLSELKAAYECFGNNPNWASYVINLVFWDGGFILFRKSIQDWMFGQKYADMVVIQSTENDAVKLCNSSRADLALVVKGGIPQIGDTELMAKFTNIKTVAATLDGKPKAIHIDLAKRIHANALKEPGLEVEAIPKRKLFTFI
ncbi:MAG: hypothetical protein GC179_08155 [Anaerolineaceae bacterium]|nr:hypothetical protein [Anaerolineaceae bacterium]